MAQRRKTKPSRLGELLVAHGLITRDQRRTALLKQKETSQRLGEILVGEAMLTRDELNWALGNLLGVPYVELEPAMVDPVAFRSLPIELLRRYHAVPLIQVGHELTLAMADPTDTQALADVEAVTGSEVKVAMADSAAIEDTLDALAAGRPAAERHIELRPEGRKPPSPMDLVADPSGSLLVQHHLRGAYQQGAGEILFQPGEAAFRVRYRIHGAVSEGASYPIAFLPNVITRLKIMANLPIESDLVFQDGRMAIDIGGKAVELVASVYTTVHGPGAQITLRAKRAEPWPLVRLGFGRPALASLRRASRAPSGLIVVCGPRRSGCSTTLYALLAAAAAPERHLVTIESSTAYRFADVTQLEVPRGPSYFNVVSKIIERPPDVLMVEGLHHRDFWAALGPQAVASTLLLGEMRAEDTLTALNQLRENQVGGSILAASLRLIVAQRLIPRLDPEHRERDRPSGQVLDRITALVPDAAAAHYYRAATTADGHKIFTGLELVYEVFEPDEAMHDLLLEGAPVARLREAAERAGLATLRECAIAKAARGLIELEEAL